MRLPVLSLRLLFPCPLPCSRRPLLCMLHNMTSHAPRRRNGPTALPCLSAQPYSPAQKGWLVGIVCVAWRWGAKSSEGAGLRSLLRTSFWGTEPRDIVCRPPPRRKCRARLPGCNSSSLSAHQNGPPMCVFVRMCFLPCVCVCVCVCVRGASSVSPGVFSGLGGYGYGTLPEAFCSVWLCGYVLGVWVVERIE